ncbi:MULTISPECIES: hypothetical protein [Lutispora]|uniref:Carboxypeptidase regulatory-like domain-containing protein n=1 Tax=Lutispora saccharofermentans TaxID=3024236 RepID=A0ABT1NKS2_9FIRM|nr:MULTISPECIES: hypothetical protein [Lutispora]MCQ1530733.1 hypothetical protein [Lutispora saccharofermentans]MEA4961502.1 hypothetical protein [Lutispora sp.]HCJ59043.1 hypothetical protein [Clostridiaceae bacterium]
MGWKLEEYNFKLTGNEEKDICITLEPEKRAAIHGVVKFPNDTPVKGALVKLFIKKPNNPLELIPVTFTFTDECGQFLFGVESKVDYVVKVFYYEPEHRVLDEPVAPLEEL